MLFEFSTVFPFLLGIIPYIYIALHEHLSVQKELGNLGFITNSIHMSATLTTMLYVTYIKCIAELIYSLRLVSCLG